MWPVGIPPPGREMTVVGTGTKASGVLMWKRIGKDHRGRGCDDVLTAADFEFRMMLQQGNDNKHFYEITIWFVIRLV